MRTVKMALLLCVGAALVVLGIANMAPVTVHLLPAGLGLPGASLEAVPLAAVMLLAVVLGIVVGQVMEWMREMRHRRRVAQKDDEIRRLRKEIKRLSIRLGEGEGDGEPRHHPRMAAGRDQSRQRPAGQGLPALRR